MDAQSDVAAVRGRVGAALLLFALGFAAYVWLWEPAVVNVPWDDAFFYLEIARNVARGLGSTVDQINQTNGFHPLWMWTLVPLARLIGSLDTLVRAVLTVQIALLFGATAWLLRRASAAAQMRALPLLLALFAGIWFLRIFVNGLEAALHYALLAAMIVQLERAHRDGDSAGTGSAAPVPAHLLFIALTGAALTLTRLTAVLFAVPAIVLAVRRPRAVLVALALYALPVGAYLLHNRLVFGHFAPISVAIKAPGEGVALGARLVKFLVVLPAIAALFIALSGPPGHRACRWRQRRFGVPLLLLLATCLCTSGFDTLVRGLVIPEPWSLVPHATLLVLLLAAGPAALEPVWRRRLTTTVLLALGAASWYGEHVLDRSTSHLAARREGLWLARNTPADAIVAGEDSGIAGAYSQRRFVNLDGLVNSWRYKEQVLDQGRLQQYLDEIGVDFVAGPFIARKLIAAASRPLRGWHAWPVVYLDCFAFGRLLGAEQHRFAQIVVARHATGPTLSQLVRQGICGIKPP